MANQRGTFAKRQREMELKDKAKQKLERRAAKKDENRTTKGPQIAWDQPGGMAPDAPTPTPGTVQPSLVPKDDAPTPSDTNDD